MLIFSEPCTDSLSPSFSPNTRTRISSNDISTMKLVFTHIIDWFCFRVIAYSHPFTLAERESHWHTAKSVASTAPPPWPGSVARSHRCTSSNPSSVATKDARRDVVTSLAAAICWRARRKTSAASRGKEPLGSHAKASRRDAMALKRRGDCVNRWNWPDGGKYSNKGNAR